MLWRFCGLRRLYHIAADMRNSLLFSSQVKVGLHFEKQGQCDIIAEVLFFCLFF